MRLSYPLLSLSCLVIVITVGAPCDPVFEDCEPEAVPRNEEDIFHPCHGTTEHTPHHDRNCMKKDEVKNVVDIRSVSVCDGRCKDYQDAGYRCAPSYTCHNNTIITDGRGIINIRSDDFLCSATSGILDASDSQCDQVDYVCCKHPNIRATKCKPVGGRPEFDQCGRSSTRLKITGQNKKDRNAQPGEFTHMCAVYRFQGAKRVYIGGASLIARNKVLTVAHKFYLGRGENIDYRDQIHDFFIRCGEHSLNNKIQLLEPQEIQALSIVIHPEYVKQRLRNDLAILQTKEDFVYQEHIGPVCLPKPFQNFDKQRSCWSSGWGPDDFTSLATNGDFLKKVQMPIVSRAECERRLKATDRFRNTGFRVHKSWVCVGGESGSDTCKGDGGSPHVCKDAEDRWVQVGAVSWGVGCGREIPAVYSSVPEAMCWIDWVMSCLENTIDYFDDSVDIFDLREDTVESRNKLTWQDCREWSKRNRDLVDKCEVRYL